FHVTGVQTCALPICATVYGKIKLGSMEQPSYCLEGQVLTHVTKTDRSSVMPNRRTVFGTACVALVLAGCSTMSGMSELECMEREIGRATCRAVVGGG